MWKLGAAGFDAGMGILTVKESAVAFAPAYAEVAGYETMK